jgi:hypothetical protein
MKPRIRFALCVLAVLLPSIMPLPARCQPGAPSHAEMRAEVPELVGLHEVIRPLWHEAWPNKDYAAMRGMLPEIQRRAQDVVDAKLPGILRERQAAWDAGVKELQAIVADYAAACAGTDDQKLLDAGERLHAQFEKLVRVSRPALPELDDFHVVLYQLYHHDKPAGVLDSIRVRVRALAAPMAALKAAKLPARLQSKQADFKAGRAQLAAAVDRLKKAVRSESRAPIDQAIDAMHESYQALAAVLE